MAAYYRRRVKDLVCEPPVSIVGALQQAYAADGFASQYTRQIQAWAEIVPKLQGIFGRLIQIRPAACKWTVLFEYPLYRLRRRIDVVILAGNLIVVIECKSGAVATTSVDRRQVEEYALDLRDFHAQSHDRSILPVLWKTEDSTNYGAERSSRIIGRNCVEEVLQLDSTGLQRFLAEIPLPHSDCIDAQEWDRSAYQPVPSVIVAATAIFAGHGVQSITNNDADNLLIASARILNLIKEARAQKQRYLIILTGVPGSGKTLAGLHVVHTAAETDGDHCGDVVYLSGNTPLIFVLREALARDEDQRRRKAGRRSTLKLIRLEARARIQHINDFLSEGFRGARLEPPHEHVIVFDEAQRAWDEKQGVKKFERTASEPSLILELMSRHSDWCACVCLVGGGQEINSGEEGVFGWGEALRKMHYLDQKKWSVFAPPDVIQGGPSAGSFKLGVLPADIRVSVETDLQLRVPRRSYRSPALSAWVDCVIAGDMLGAREEVARLQQYPIVITRSLLRAKRWLMERVRGERRYGLLASSMAQRLRAEGLGVTLQVSAGDEIAHWYLNPLGDIRSSFALEVPANEYTCQGLELDFGCICWGGDLLWSDSAQCWAYSRLSGTSWRTVHHSQHRRFLANSYRVLLTRSREGMVLWIPSGEDSDSTRAPEPLDKTAAFLLDCGAVSIDLVR